MSLQEMEDLKQHYLDEMLSLSNDLGIKDYHNEKIDIRFRRECENMIDELKGKFNGMSIEINKKKELQQLEHATKLSTYTTEPSRRFNYFYDDDDEDDVLLTFNRDIISKLPPSIAITSVLPTLEPEDSLIMGNKELSTIPKKESDEFIKSSVEDLSSNPIESRGYLREWRVVLFYLVDDESLSEEDVQKDNVKIYSNPLFEFNDEYISSDVNSLFDEVLGDIECKDSYDSNLDESTFLVTPLSDSNEDEFFAQVDDILYDAPIDDLIFDPGGDIDEIDTFLNVDISTDIEDGYHDSEGDILYLKSFLSNDTILNPHPKVFLDHDQKSLSDINDLKIMVKNAFREKQHQPEDIQELLHKLLKDLQILREELADYINTPNLNYPAFYDDDDEYTIQYREYLENSSNAITPDLPTEEPDNSLSMGDEHLSTISETESDKVIKSSVEDLVSILSDDDDSFENIDYVETSLPDSELVILEEVKDDILCEKLLNINLLIAKIESLNDNPTPDCVLKSPSSFPIPVEDSDSFFEKSDTSLSYSDNSLPEFETFSDHTKETRSGSTTTHADNSLPEYDSFLFEIELDQGELTSVVMEDMLGEPHVHMPNVLPTHPTLMLDSDFIPSDDSLRSDLEGKITSDFSESPMMISGGDIPFLDVLCLHFYPPLPVQVWGSSQAQDSINKNKRFVGGNPCLSLVVDCPDYEDSRARGFVHRPLDLQSFACLYMGI
ncbi:hypothetical protein Tco_0594775 [Tanacetum coccineum]